MTLAYVTDPEAVLSAMEQCRLLGRDRFRKKYGFGEAKTYFLEWVSPSCQGVRQMPYGPTGQRRV